MSFVDLVTFRMMDGVLVIDKPAGLTSHDVVAAVRRATAQKRVGHTGTLDPFATGVLPLVLGRATRLSRFLTASTKRYVAGVRLGIATDTYDTTGVPVGEPAPKAAITVIDSAAVETALDQFRGEFRQVPPPFSAKKMGGVRAYKLARQQRAVTPVPATVAVHALRLVSVVDGLVTLEIACSAGFYVRSLAHDLGGALGVGAHLEQLQRTANGEFTIQHAVSLSQLLAEGATVAASHLVPLDGLLVMCPAAELTETGVHRIRHGRTVASGDIRRWVTTRAGEGGPIRLLAPDGRLLALAATGVLGAPLLRPTVVLV